MNVSQIMRTIRLHPLSLAAALMGALCAAPASAQNAAPAAAKPAATAPAATAPAGAAKPAAAAKTAGFVPPATSSGNLIDAVAVVVNDEVITKNEIDARVKTIEQRMKAQNAPMPDAADMRRQVLEQMIAERAQIQLAKEMGVRVDDQMLDRAIGRIAEGQKISLQDMRNQIEKDGMSYAGFREEIRNEIMLQRLREHEVDGKIQISDAEVDTYLATEKAAAAEQVELNISQIMVRIPENAGPEQIAARKAKADDVARQLRTGADFAKIAATYSDAPDALQGGAIGWRDPNKLPQLFADQLIKLRPGQVTPVIKTSGGFYILKVADKRNPAAAAEAAPIQQVHARHILLKVTPTMTAAEAKRKLLDLKERLDNKAAKFEDLAKLVSNDSSATKGGDLGWLYPGDVVPEMEAAMADLKPGQVSGVVETPYGYHLIEVIERKSEDVSKERARNAARNVIRERKLAEATDDWARQVRDRAYVEFREDR
ncbi:MAG: peptidylprolyl isomerase [Massilia sp.]